MTTLRVFAVLLLATGCASGSRAGDRPGYFYRSLAELQHDSATNRVMHIHDCPAAALAEVPHASTEGWRELRYPTFRICLPAEWVLTRDGWQGDGGNYDRVTIAGSVAEIWDEPAQPQRDGQDHYAYAVYGLWRDRNFYVTGRAASRAAVNAQRSVMQTVRFTTQ